MRDIEFDCIHCHSPLVVEDSGAGLAIPCPVCARPITIPSPPPSDPSVPPSPGLTAEEFAALRQSLLEELRRTEFPTPSTAPPAPSAPELPPSAARRPLGFPQKANLVEREPGHPDIEFDCVHCEQHLLSELSGAGLQIDCPNCHNPLVIPAPAPSAVARDPRPAALPPAFRGKRVQIKPIPLRPAAPEPAPAPPEPEPAPAPAEPDPQRRKGALKPGSARPSDTEPEPADLPAPEPEPVPAPRKRPAPYRITPPPRPAVSADAPLPLSDSYDLRPPAPAPRRRLLPILLVLTAVSALAVAGIFLPPLLFPPPPAPAPAPSAPTFGEKAPPTGLFNLSSVQPDEATREQARKVVETYCNAPNWTSRLPLIRDPARLAPILAAYYASRPDGPLPYRELLFRSAGDIEGYPVLLLSVTTLDFSELYFILEQTPDGLLVDWETLSEYNPFTWDEFKKNRSISPVPARVNLTPDTYYNYQFSDSAQYACYRLSDRSGTPLGLYAYAERGTDTAEKLSRLMPAEGVTMACIVKLRYLADGSENNLLRITEFVQASWMTVNPATPPAVPGQSGAIPPAPTPPPAPAPAVP